MIERHFAGVKEALIKTSKSQAQTDEGNKNDQ
jgi:hypothetical protein